MQLLFTLIVLQHILHRHAILKESDQNLPPMSDQKQTHIRMALIIINEIFMLDIYQQLKEIFAYPFNQLFTGLSIIVAGDLY